MSSIFNQMVLCCLIHMAATHAMVTAEYKIKKTRSLLLIAGQVCVDDIKTLLECLESICDGRFNWPDAKQIIESVQNILPLDEYEESISNGEVKTKSANKQPK